MFDGGSDREGVVREIADEQSPLLDDGAPGAQEVDNALSWREIVSGSWLPVAMVFMIGSAADYYDGTSFGAGFPDIGALYKQEQSAAWLIVAYATVSAAMQPVYSVLCIQFDWEPPLLGAYLAFALGQTIASYGGLDTDLRNSKAEFYDMVPLLTARVVTAVGASAMVYIPNLVLNVLAPEDERAGWEGVQAIFNSIGQWYGREAGSNGFTGRTHFRRTFQRQLPAPVVCFLLLSAWLVYRVRVMPQDNRTKPCLQVTKQPNPPSGVSARPAMETQAIASIILLALGVGGVCISVGIFAEYFLLPDGKRGLNFVLVTLCPLLLGCSCLFGVVTNERHMRDKGYENNLFPFDLTPSVRKTIGFIFLVTFLKNIMIDMILFVLPWYSTASSTTKEWLFRWLDFGVPVGSGITGLLLKKWKCRNQQSFASPKQTICAGAATLVIAALGMAANWASIQHGSLSHAMNFALSFGDSTVGAALLPCLLNELSEQKQKHQAIVYCGLHLAGNVAFSITTMMSNIVLRVLAGYYMRADLVADQDVESCFTDLKGCLDSLTPHTQAAVRQAFLRTSRWFACAVLTGSMAIVALIACQLKDYKLSTRKTEVIVAEDATRQD